MFKKTPLLINALAIVTIIVVAIFGIRALFVPGFYTSHDGLTHLSRIAQYTTALKEGQFPPRWAGTLNGKLGYPVFVYSYHLPYILGSSLHLLGFSLYDSLKILLGFSYLFSGIGMYLFLKCFFTKKASIFGSIIFLYAPFWFLLIFVRVALGEQLLLALAPWILFCVCKFSKNTNLKSASILALVMGLAILAHPYFIPIYFPVVIALIILLHFQQKKVNWRKKILYVLYISILMFGISAFQVAPQIMEQQYIIGNKMHAEQYKFLISLKQFIYSPWGVGFDLEESHQDGMSFQLGLTQWLILILTAFVLSVSIIKMRLVENLKKIIFLKNENNSQLKMVILMLVVFILTVILIVDWRYTILFWRNLWHLSGIDFPWRYIPICIIAIATCAAFVAERFRFYQVLIPIIIILAIVANRNHWRPNLLLNETDDYYYADLSTTTYANEFNPKWRISKIFDKVEPRFLTLGEPQKLEIIKKSNVSYQLHTTFQYDQNVQMNILYFPGWRFYILKEKGWQEMFLGKEIFIVDDAQFGYTKDQIEGTMQINVPAQEQLIRVEYNETPLRKLANIISISALLIIIIIFIL